MYVCMYVCITIFLLLQKLSLLISVKMREALIRKESDKKLSCLSILT